MIKRVFFLVGISIVVFGCQAADMARHASTSRVEGGSGQAAQLDQLFEIVAVAPAPDTDVNRRRDRYRLRLRKSALGRKFLLQTSIKPQNFAPTSSGLKARLVYFKRDPDPKRQIIYLMESTDGHVVSKDLPARLILAEFEFDWKKNRMEIDFAGGMAKVFTQGGWYANDYYGRTYDPKKVFAATEVDHSYVDSIRFSKGVLDIVQKAQLRRDEYFPSVEVRYYLRLYRSNPNYKSRLNPDRDFEWFGAFEIPPKITRKGGRPNQLQITRWDLSKPITFYITENTPGPFFEAIKEGVLYWNKAFGKDVLKVKRAPIGVRAPDPHYNVIQWVPWDAAGFAYADAQMDPLTGEILHAQIYMTSVFAFGSRARVRRLLRQLRKKPVRPFTAHKLALKGIEPSHLCKYELEATAERVLEQVLVSDMDDDEVRRLSQDYIRLIAAHEVGHVLGLRHNFAGSLGTNAAAHEQAADFARYVLKGETRSLADRQYSSSVMDYLPYAQDVLIGAQMNRKDSLTALPYDHQMIKWLYEGVTSPVADRALYCADKQIKKFVDCNKFDAGTDPLDHAHWQLGRYRKHLAPDVIETFIGAKTPIDDQDKKELDQVDLKPKAKAQKFATYVAAILPLFQKQTRVLAYDRKYPHQGARNAEAIRKKRYQHLRGHLLQVGAKEGVPGGLARTVFPYLPGVHPQAPDPAPWLQMVDDLLARPFVVKGVGPNGDPYELTPKEQSFIRKEAGWFVQEFDRHVVEAVIDVLLKAKPFEEPKTASNIESHLAAVAKAVILTSGQHAGDFLYPHEMRKKAAGLLRPGQGPKDVLDWSWDGRFAVKVLLETKIKKYLGLKAMKDLKVKSLNRSKRQWYLQQKEILVRLVTPSSPKPPLKKPPKSKD